MSDSLSDRVCDNLWIDETSVHTTFLYMLDGNMMYMDVHYMHDLTMALVLNSLFYSQGRSLVWKESATHIVIQNFRSSLLKCLQK